MANSPTRPEEQFHFNEFQIPPYMRESLIAYVEEHRPIGSFLQAVLENNLYQTFGRADSDNVKNIPAYVNFLYWHVPSICWGSPAKVKAWLESRIKGEDNET